MFTLTTHTHNALEFIDIQNPDSGTKAQFCLNQGGRLSALQFSDVKVLANYEPSSYADNYASAILFPFVNRIRDGKYNFEGETYTLNCNEVDKNNALHGLVYNKTFKCTGQDLASGRATIILQYQHDGTSKGFPFKFDLELAYTLTDSSLILDIKVTNNDIKPFPFTLGWHPYFVSDNLNQSTLDFKSDVKYLFDAQQIITDTALLKVKMPCSLKDKILDDGYVLQSDAIVFNSPTYELTITGTSQQNYLQLYTPNTPNVIAIEPMTGAADSFNNKFGLQTLGPQDRYSVAWKLAFKKP